MNLRYVASRWEEQKFLFVDETGQGSLGKDRSHDAGWSEIKILKTLLDPYSDIVRLVFLHSNPTYPTFRL
jgi:hypothetical protein